MRVYADVFWETSIQGNTDTEGISAYIRRGWFGSWLAAPLAGSHRIAFWPGERDLLLGAGSTIHSMEYNPILYCVVF